MIYEIVPTNIKNLDLNLLKALDALLDERSVTRAAERLSLTQPAVSGMLTRLRESFDDPLFVRTQRGIAPTLRAQALAGPLKELLCNAEALLRPQGFDPATAHMTLRIAATDYALQAVVLPFLAVLRQRAPGVCVAVVPAQHLPLHERLERGDIDLALITPENTAPDLHARRLFDERYVCVMRADHPDARRRCLSLARFCELDHALVSYGGGSFRGVTDEAPGSPATRGAIGHQFSGTARDTAQQRSDRCRAAAPGHAGFGSGGAGAAAGDPGVHQDGCLA